MNNASQQQIDEETIYWEMYEEAELKARTNDPLLNEPDDERVHQVICCNPNCSAVLLAYSPQEKLVCDTDCQRELQEHLAKKTI